jgi:hypothetical protein
MASATEKHVKDIEKHLEQAEKGNGGNLAELAKAIQELNDSTRKTGLLERIQKLQNPKKGGRPRLEGKEKENETKRREWVDAQLMNDPDMPAGKLLDLMVSTTDIEFEGSTAKWSTFVSTRRKRVRKEEHEPRKFSVSNTGGRSMNVMEARALAERLGGINEAKAAIEVLKGIDLKTAGTAIERWETILKELDGDEKKAALIYSMIAAK